VNELTILSDYPAINLVSTRCVDGNHQALQRWYNDHAQLLMVSKELQGAELHRVKGSAGMVDYFCLYHFEVLERFAAFDSGDVMAEVRDLSNAAPGRSSIEIVKRTQYQRVLNRRWASEPAVGEQAILLELHDDSLPQTIRWLNDVVYALHLLHQLQAVQVYVAQMPTCTELFVLIQQGSQPLPENWLDVKSPFAERGSLRIVWQAQAERIGRWLR
jgi:hypothetical protein